MVNWLSQSSDINSRDFFLKKVSSILSEWYKMNIYMIEMDTKENVKIFPKVTLGGK